VLKINFEKCVGAEVSKADWEIIETVYTNHPCIKRLTEADSSTEILDDHDSRQRLISRLWWIGGNGIMKDLLRTALKVKELREELEGASMRQGVIASKLEHLQQEYSRRKE